MNPHFTALEAAFQLHYYLCFKTHYLNKTLDSDEVQKTIRSTLVDVCEPEHYSLLESAISTDHLRLLISLRPEQTVTTAVRLLKGNLDHAFRKSHRDSLRSSKLFARGYFARTSGSADLEQVRKYVESQVSHHGYKGKWTEPLEYSNPNFVSPAFSFDHCVSILNYHLVFVTQERKAIFDESMATPLFDYVLAVGKKHDFAVDRIGLLPDHMHLIIEGVPTVSVEQYAFALMNNTAYWMTKEYSGVLKETDAWGVWQPSYYAGTLGEYTTAQVNAFLRNAR
jgi:putative transposase